jgi:hypothetical protein
MILVLQFSGSLNVFSLAGFDISSKSFTEFKHVGSWWPFLVSYDRVFINAVIKSGFSFPYYNLSGNITDQSSFLISCSKTINYATSIWYQQSFLHHYTPYIFPAYNHYICPVEVLLIRLNLPITCAISIVPSLYLTSAWYSHICVDPEAFFFILL